MPCDALLKRLVITALGHFHPEHLVRRRGGIPNHGHGSSRWERRYESTQPAFRVPVRQHAASAIWAQKPLPDTDEDKSRSRIHRLKPRQQQTNKSAEDDKSLQTRALPGPDVPIRKHASILTRIRKHASITTRVRCVRLPHSSVDHEEDERESRAGEPCLSKGRARPDHPAPKDGGLEPPQVHLHGSLKTSGRHKSTNFDNAAKLAHAQDSRAPKVRKIDVSDEPPIQFFHASNKVLEKKIERQSRRWHIGIEGDPELDLITFRQILQLLDSKTPSSSASQCESNSDDLLNDGDAFLWDELEHALDDLTYTPNRATTGVRLTLAREPFLKRPGVFTELSFLAYTDELTGRKTPSQPAGSASADQITPKPSSDEACDELLAIFTDPELRHCIRSESLNACIRFLTKYKRYDSLHRISNQLEHYEYSLNISNLDALVACAARQGSARLLRYWLRYMVQHDMHPTSNTWLAVHRVAAAKYPEQVASVEKSMREKGLMIEQTVVSRLALNVISANLTAAIAEGGELDMLLHEYDVRYGNNRAWLTRPVINTIIAVLLNHARADEALKFSQESAPHSSLATLNGAASTMNVFVANALRKQDMEAAVQYMSAGMRYTEATALTFGILFQLAWKTRHFNCLRVIWRFACASGQVTQTMRARMLSGLHMVRQTPAQKRLSKAVTAVEPNKGKQIPEAVLQKAEWTLRSRLWDYSAPHFALCVHADLDPIATESDEATLVKGELVKWNDKTQPSSLQQQQNELQSLLLGRKLSRSRRTDLRPTKKYWELLLRRDVKEGTEYTPAEPFVAMLERAYEKDCEWKQGSFSLMKAVREPQRIDSMLEHGIEVPMLPKSGRERFNYRPLV